MPFLPRLQIRERENTPCISLRQLRRAGALKLGTITMLRWYEDKADALVMVPEVKAEGEDVAWHEPEYQAVLLPWDGQGKGLPPARFQPHTPCGGIEMRFSLASGEAVTQCTRFTYSRAGFGWVQHLQCRTCDKPCDILCVDSVAGRLECPKCYGLDYRSQHRNRYERAALKCDRILRRLGDVYLDGREWPEKPKWMRWPTFERLLEQAQRYDAYYQANSHRCRCFR